MNAFGIDSEMTPESEQRIAGDRRSDRRYDLSLELRWKLIRRRRVLDAGVGTTLDLSSGGVLFQSERQLPAGAHVELAISWPVLLHNVAPLQLVISGRIVRAAGQKAAIRTIQHEFRTARLSAENRATMNAARGGNPNRGFEIQ